MLYFNHKYEMNKFKDIKKALKYNLIQDKKLNKFF